MIQTSFTVVGGEAVATAFRRARPELEARWDRTTRKHLFKALRVIQTRYRGAGRTTATATRQGTGHLRASYIARVTRSPERTGVTGELGLFRYGARGAALVYGHVHEEGATIRPRRSQFLAIPLPAIRNPSGVSPRPADFPRSETFVLKSRTFAGGVIVRKLADGTIQPLFKLARQVVTPARPPGGAINAALREVEPSLYAELEADATAVIGGAG